MLLNVNPMRPVDARQLRSPRTSAQARVQQAAVMVCAIPFVVLVIVGAPFWGWAVALAAGLALLTFTEYVLRRRNLPRSPEPR